MHDRPKTALGELFRDFDRAKRIVRVDKIAKASKMWRSKRVFCIFKPAKLRARRAARVV